MDRRLYRRALRILITGRLACYPRGRRGDRLRAELARFARRHRSWLGSAAIEGFTFGRKRVGGRETDVPSLIVFVRRKRSKARVSLPVPARIRIPTLGVFVTDVVAVGTFRHHAGPPFTATQRPLQPGACLGVTGGAAGTLGCFVKKLGSNMPLILSCAHVLENDFLPGSALTVEQTATRYQPPGGNYAVGTYLEKVPLKFTSNINDFSNQADAALASVDPALLPVEPRMRINGLRPGVTGAIVENDTVRKVGFATGETTGIIAHAEVPKSIKYPAQAGAGQQRRAGYYDLVACTYESQEGDSGSLVMSANGEVLGLHLGSDKVYSYFCRFEHIAARLGVELY